MTVLPSLQWAPHPPGLGLAQACFYMGAAAGSGHHRLCPLLSLLEDICLVLDEDSFFSPGPGRRTGWSRASARMGTPRAREEHHGRQIQVSGIVCYGSKAPLRHLGAADEVPSFCTASP